MGCVPIGALNDEGNEEPHPDENSGQDKEGCRRSKHVLYFFREFLVEENIAQALDDILRVDNTFIVEHDHVIRSPSRVVIVGVRSIRSEKDAGIGVEAILNAPRIIPHEDKETDHDGCASLTVTPSLKNGFRRGRQIIEDEIVPHDLLIRCYFGYNVIRHIL